MKYLRVYLTKEVKDLYNEDFKPPKEELEKDQKMEWQPMIMDWFN